MTTLIDILIVAVAANVITDLYELALERFLGKTRDWHLVGRWGANLLKGKLFLNSADETRAVSGELVLGWVIHYIVAVAYVAIYLLSLRICGASPSLESAVAFGVITVAAPWFILMPCLGVGAFAKNAARPNFVRGASLSVHVVFGVGIYLGTVTAGLV